jgi:succinoglycan biosynthesis transport protein ExoP
MADRAPISNPNWLQPPAEQAGLRQYIGVLRERYVLIIAAVVLCLAAAAIYLATADKVYEAQADLLVTPAPPDDTLLSSLGVMRASSDPTRDVETAAKFVTNSEVAERARSQLGLDRSADSLLKDVTAEPVGQSAIVAITGKASTAGTAAALANAFAAGVVSDRTEALHNRIDKILSEVDTTDTTGAPLPSGSASAATAADQIARLQLLRDSPDPTIAVENRATPPASAASPKPKLTLVAAAFAGVIIGIAAAFAAQTLDPRLRREEQLRANYQLPILARVPAQRSQRGKPLMPAALAPPTREAYRTLRANIVAAHRGTEGQAILVTGSAPSEGKTTTAINLAASLAMAGADTLLIEADLRRPSIGRTLGVSPTTGVVSTLLENASVDDSVVSRRVFGRHLKLLLADRRGAWTSELFSPSAAERLVREAKGWAEFVVIDSPPLTAVIDALPLAREADNVVIVTRPGTTRLDKLHELAELLNSNGITPLGFALIGAPQSETGYAYYESDEPSEEEPPSSPAEVAETPSPVADRRSRSTA